MTFEEKDLRRSLVQHALDLLESQDEVPSLRAVARAAGISAMTPYNYFADKAALMGAVADRGFEMMAMELAAADDSEDPVEALVAQGVTLVRFAEANPALFRLIYSHEYGHATTESVARTYGILQDRIRTLIPSRVSAATLACRSLVQGMATILLNGRLGTSDPNDIEAAIRLLVEGLVAVEARERSRARTRPEP